MEISKVLSKLIFEGENSLIHNSNCNQELNSEKRTVPQESTAVERGSVKKTHNLEPPCTV